MNDILLLLYFYGCFLQACDGQNEFFQISRPTGVLNRSGPLSNVMLTSKKEVELK